MKHLNSAHARVRCRTTAAACVLAGMAACTFHGAAAFAQTEAPDPDSALYIESVVYAKRGAICTARLSGYADSFEPVYAKWQAERAPQLKRGEVVLREALAKEGVDFSRHLSALTDPPARHLGKASQRVLEANCQAMLQRLDGG